MESKPQTLLNSYLAEIKRYLGEVLPQFIIIDSKTLSILFEEGAVEFINHESGINYYSEGETSMRCKAIELWRKIANMESENFKINNPTELLTYSLQLLQSWTYEFQEGESEQIKRDVGCVLLEKMHLKYEPMRFSEIGGPLVNKIIIDNLRNSNCQHGFLLVGRAFELAYGYSSWLTVGVAEIIKNYVIQLYSSVSSSL